MADHIDFPVKLTISYRYPRRDESDVYVIDAESVTKEWFDLLCSVSGTNIDDFKIIDENAVIVALVAYFCGNANHLYALLKDYDKNVYEARYVKPGLSILNKYYGKRVKGSWSTDMIRDKEDSWKLLSHSPKRPVYTVDFEVRS